MNKEEMRKKEAFKNLQNELREVLHSLTPFEQDVLSMRFGLNENYSHSLDEVCKKFDISIEQIRMIEAKVLRKLRHKKEEQNNTAAKDIQNKIVLSSSQKQIMEILCSLPSREQKIVTKKFGLDNAKELSDKAVLNEYKYTNLTQEELNAIIEKVNRRLEHKPDEFIEIKI
jgi:DNA-directed RNA polymerase sigma subunit (sigma70/sigma32)